jgi:hypothetical protein
MTPGPGGGASPAKADVEGMDAGWAQGVLLTLILLSRPAARDAS